MSTRLTVVFEYPDGVQQPRMGPETTNYEGAKVVSCQFSDALEELESVLEKLELLEAHHDS